MIGKKLKELRNKLNLTQQDLANVFGIKQNTLSQYENEVSEIPDFLKIKLQEKYNVNLNWLLTGEGEMFIKGGEVATEDGNKQIIKVPILNIRAAAGKKGIDKYYNGNDEIIDYINIDIGLLKGYNVKKIRTILARGDSMSPTINDGDIVFVVENLIEGNGIYVIKRNEDLLVKRLQFKYDNTLVIISDNPAYDKELIKPGDEITVDILGKAIGYFKYC